MVECKLQTRVGIKTVHTSQNDINSNASCSDKKFNPQTFPKEEQSVLNKEKLTLYSSKNCWAPGSYGVSSIIRHVEKHEAISVKNDIT